MNKKINVLVLGFMCVFALWSSVHGADRSSLVSDKSAINETMQSLPSGSGRETDIIDENDQLRIQVYREQELSGLFVVGTNGMVDYPLLGKVKARGLRLEEFRREIQEGLKAKYLVDPQVQVVFNHSTKKTVSILGLVKNPGNYDLLLDFTLSKLISRAASFLPAADQHQVNVIRTGPNGMKETLTADVQAIMEGRSADIPLQAGDLVVVLEKKNVSILGQVVKPGNYDYMPDLTLFKLITQAGSFTPIAGTTQVRMIRNDGAGSKTTLMVDVDSITAGKSEDLKLQAGDFIVVPESERMVTILGQVNKAGDYRYTPDITLVKLVSRAEGFTRYAAMNNIRVTQTGTGGAKKIIQVNFDSIINGSGEDIALLPGDVVYVPESYF